jgi:hypothetical protein
VPDVYKHACMIVLRMMRGACIRGVVFEMVQSEIYAQGQLCDAPCLGWGVSFRSDAENSYCGRSSNPLSSLVYWSQLSALHWPLMYLLFPPKLASHPPCIAKDIQLFILDYLI